MLQLDANKLVYSIFFYVTTATARVYLIFHDAPIKETYFKPLVYCTLSIIKMCFCVANCQFITFHRIAKLNPTGNSFSVTAFMC